MSRHKRRRGGQPGNQNARKHGFYSVHLTPQEISEFWSILNNGASEPELVVLRMKVLNLSRYAPGNARLLREVKRLLYKWCVAKYGFSRGRQSKFRAVIRAFFGPSKNGKNNLPGPIEAKA